MNGGVERLPRLGRDTQSFSARLLTSVISVISVPQHPPLRLGREAVRERLLGDPIIREAVVAHAAETNVDETAVWARVEEYIREIVPSFSVAYYRLGYRAAEWLLNLFYKVTVEH